MHCELNIRSFGRPIAATVGSYDGVHLGHRVLLEKTRAEAERIGGESLVITFEPHPRLALDPECGMKLLSPGEEKRRLLDQAGIDHLLIIPFDRAFSRMTPSDFLHLLVEQIGVRSLVVGYDHRFGCDKSGSHALLERLKGELGLDVTEVAEREVESEHVSSTVVRRLIEQGEVAHAARLLGHPYLLHGEVKASGEVTPCDSHKLLPAKGEYRVRIEEQEATLRIQEGEMQLTDCKIVAGVYFIEFIK